MYHSGEVAAFWLLCALMEKYNLKEVHSPGMPGLAYHMKLFERLGREHIGDLFKHLDKNYVDVDLFCSEWLISIFLNMIPLELTGIYLDLFFENGWPTLYKLGI